jgi:hypothetical protein
MFDFVVKYGSFLKHIPFLPLLFDSMLILWSGIFNKELINCIEDIENEVTQWEGINISIHKFGGIQFNYQKKEIGHIHGNGLVDILFNKEIKGELIKAGKAEEHHVFKNSGWVSFYIRSSGDKKNALQLLNFSYKNKINSNYLISGYDKF